MKSYKQLQPSEWIYFFELYEKDIERFYYEYYFLRNKQITKYRKNIFKNK